MTDPKIIHRRVTCPNGHRIKLEVEPDSPNLIQTIQCPTCEVDSLVIVGILRAVLPDQESS